MCHSAIIAGARRCVNDNKFHVQEDYAYADDGKIYSLSYANENFYWCRSCGRYITNPENYNFETDLCNPCDRKRRRRELIGRYHENKGNYEKIGDFNDYKTIGFEAEVISSYADSLDAATDIYDEFGDVFLFEEDSSLDYGSNHSFEIISQPHTVDALEDLDLERLEDILYLDGYAETDENRSSGLHVHFSSHWFGDTSSERIKTLARVIRFYNHNYTLLLDLSERDGCPYHYANANDEEHQFYFGIEEYDEYGYYIGRTEFDIYDDYELVSESVRDSRYVAVNCEHFCSDGYGTVEFRLGNGSIRAEYIRAWIDLHIAIIEFCQNNDSVDAHRMLRDYASQRVKEYYTR